MKILFVTLALAVSCAVAKKQIIPSASLAEALDNEITALLPHDQPSVRHKYVCYWFGCIWVPDWFPGNEVTTEAPFECTSVGVFPSRDDCSKFIICQDSGDGFFIEHDMNCPAGLVFNPDTHRCDHLENVPSCAVAKSEQIIPSASLANAIDNEIKSLLPHEEPSVRHKYVCYWFGCIWVPDWFPGNEVTTEAPFECTSAGLFPSRDDCSKFIICQNSGDGFFIENDMNCPAGLVFNPDTHRCDHLENVPSCAVAKSEQIIPSASLAEAIDNEIKSLLPHEEPSVRHKYVCYWFGCIWVPDWFPGNEVTTEAPFECTSVGLFPSRDDCSKFIICQNSGDGFFIEHDMNCPSGLVYNPANHRCDHLENVPSCQS